MVDIVIIKSESLVNNSILENIFDSLKKKYHIIGLGWNREGISTETIKKFFVTLKLFNLRSKFGKKSLIFKLPFFWWWIFLNLIILRPNVIHAFDLDILFPCFTYKKIFRKKVIFHIFDRYAMTYISPKHKKLFSMVNKIEEFFATNVDVLISPTPKLLSSFKKQPKICEIILNCPKDHKSEKLKQSKKGLLTLAYAGNILKRRGLERITSAIKDLNGVELLIAGRVMDRNFLEKILENSNVKYMNFLNPKKALSMVSNSDAVVSLYDLSIPNYNLAYAVKNFDAMMLGLPVISNISKELFDEFEFGIFVDYNNEKEIKSAIVRLRDDVQFRKKLGDNSRKAFEHKYNWKNQEIKLYKIYDDVLH